MHIELKGLYGEAKVMTEDLEAKSQAQIEELLNQKFSQNLKIRIMPDVHLGKGCVIGFTANFKDKVIPNIVGVDIGCGMLTIKLPKVELDFDELDRMIRYHIPSGKHVHRGIMVDYQNLNKLHVYKELKDTHRIRRSLGSLGGGNHFIEVAHDSKKQNYMIIHSGSRNLGKQVAQLYQRKAIHYCATQKLDIPRDLAYLEGQLKDHYLHDMKLVQEYASLNRKTMANLILKPLYQLELSDLEHFETIHNYINFKDNITRKGAISAYEDELLLIPINMADGSILAKGKGNPDWNYSAPHGAGRLMSRNQAFKELNLEHFKTSMKHVYSTSVSQRTLDESPFVYKSMDYILNRIEESVSVIDILKPIYNFKAP